MTTKKIIGRYNPFRNMFEYGYWNGSRFVLTGVNINIGPEQIAIK